MGNRENKEDSDLRGEVLMTVPFESMETALPYYTANGIIVHPIHGPEANVGSPGKAPIPLGWQKKTTPYDRDYMRKKIDEGCNLGANCGEPSNLTVIDIDFYTKGIWDGIFDGIDTSDFVIQIRTEKDGKKHIFFKYTPLLKTSTYQALGFDIRNDGGNIVLAPSIHAEGDVYKLYKSIEERTEVPEIVIERINKVIALYEGLKKVFQKCRSPFYKLWKDFCENKNSNTLRDPTIFRQADGRNRCLSLFAELSANGATSDQLILACKIIFGENFNEEKSAYEISKINPECTAHTSTLEADEYYSKYLSKKTNETHSDSSSTVKPRR